MSYKLIVTSEMNRLLDEKISYLVSELMNRQAAKHLLTEIDKMKIICGYSGKNIRYFPIFIVRKD